jgi:HD-GYP domain-containing protein (c-di-GMP phosphodiesterase class II)
MAPTPQSAPETHRLLKSFGALRALTAMYPVGHPLVAEKVREICDASQQIRGAGDWLRLDVIHGVVYLDGVACDGPAAPAGLGFDSLHLRADVRHEDIVTAADLLRTVKPGGGAESLERQLAQRGIDRVSIGRLVPIDTRWSAPRWADEPETVYDSDYAESLAQARQTFEELVAGGRLDVGGVRDLVRLLVQKVVSSNAALAQILAVKRYENLTYIHSVNVAVLSLLLGRKLLLPEEQLNVLVEAAVLHDVGKTRIPIDLVKKPGALDRRERKMMEAHPLLGAELLAEIDGLSRLTPVVALEHHRTVLGSGYPDLGQGVVPHVLSQIVSVADIYEAVTGARSYQEPTPPERACLLLARLAGEKLNASLVKAFVGAITFFPIGSVVRTSLDELAVVIGTNLDDPLHPMIQLVTDRMQPISEVVDTRERDRAGAYARHVVATIEPPANDGALVARLLAA